MAIGIKSKQHSSGKFQASKDGFNLMIDKNKIKDLDEIISLLEDGIENLTPNEQSPVYYIITAVNQNL